MKNKSFLLALMAGSSLACAPPVFAQENGEQAAEPASLTPEEAAAKAAFLEAQVEALQAQLDALKSQVGSVTPGWKGAPQFTDKESGWSFKPRGRLQLDAGWVGRPDGVTDRSLGFANEIRRARLGVEGTVPGGFGYKFELDFADNNVEITDALLSYDASARLGLVIGQHNGFQSLEELTSSRFLSFMERAAFTDAFNFERRLGVSATYTSGNVIASAGVFTDNVTDLANDENDALGFDARLVFAPKVGNAQLHFGGSAHLRDNGDLAVTGITTRYRQRPLVHTTDVRFLATPALAVKKETNYGLEAAAISGPFHAAGEVHWLKANRLAGVDPTFFGGYAEVGYYLTGETRGYKNGQFDRTKVLKPVGQGGFGAVQINLRYDHLDLNDGGILGGRQRGYQASLVWIPQDYVRFLLNYGRMSYGDAAIPAAGGDRDYSIDVFGARTQIDF
jgi:phosphate-selective porin OprO/OprP